MKYFLTLLLSLPFCGFSQNDNYITNKDYNEFINYIGCKDGNEKELSPNENIWFKDATLNVELAKFLADNYFIHSQFEKYPIYGLSSIQIQKYLDWKYPKEEKTYNVSNQFEIDLTLLKENLQFTVGDYFKFYKNVRDSVVRKILAEEVDEEKYYFQNNYDEDIDPLPLNWRVKINWKDTMNLNALKYPYFLLTKDNKIDNQKINCTYYWINYRRAIRKDTIRVKSFIKKEIVNLYNKKYMNEYSPISIKKKLKSKAEMDYTSLTFEQLRAFYYWEKSGYSDGNIFEGFIPDDNTIQLLQEGKLPDSFYNFKITIPTITVK